MSVARVLLISSSIILLVLALNLARRAVLPQPEDDGYYTVLVLGTDVVQPNKLDDWKGRSDLILLIIYNRKDNRVAIVSVPRDCIVYLKRRGGVIKPARINSTNQLGGYQLARTAVETLLGIKIDKVVVFSITGFKELLDKVGKVEINVPKQLSYHDYKQDLHIEIAPGKQLMDGETMIKFLRYRDKDQGDIGRIKRQQIFFRAAIKKLTEPSIIIKAPELVKAASELFLTDMKAREMLSLGSSLRSVPKRNYSGYMVPGDFAKDGSWTVKQPELHAMMSKIIRNNDH